MQGINNLGATCAINSLIQIICRCSKLRDVILNANVPDDSFTGELKEILDLLHNKNVSLNPIKFLNCFYKTFENIFNKYEQIDINELWIYVFEKINEETSISYKPKTDFNNIYEEHDLKIAIYNNNKYSNILKLVQGSFINVIQCDNCNNISHSFEPFINIALNIENENVSIVDLLMNNFKVENRDKDEWKCDKCNDYHSYKKTFKIWKIPDILFISLNRFQDIHKKNYANIHINSDIIFNKGSISTKDVDCKYNLKSVGLHHGNLSNGHYNALCYNNNIFTLFNDESVNTIDEPHLLNKINNAYIMLYEID
jgi:ubiquitin C-terminal hydrolase